MSTQALLDERYGRRRERRSGRLVIGVAVAIGLVAAGLVAWTTVTTAAGSVDADGTGFSVVDERAVTVSFQVSGGTDRPIACALEAQDVEHGVVGWRVVEYPASGELTRSFTETIPTVAEATTGLVTSCWIP